MKLEPYLRDEIRVLESRLADRTLPVAEHDRLRARLQDIRRQLSGVPSPDEVNTILKRIEALEEGQAKLHELIAYLEAKLTVSAKDLTAKVRDQIRMDTPGQVTCDAVNQLSDLQMLPPEAKTAKRGRPRKLPQFPGPTPETTAEPISESLDDFLSE